MEELGPGSGSIGPAIPVDDDLMQGVVNVV